MNFVSSYLTRALSDSSLFMRPTRFPPEKKGVFFLFYSFFFSSCIEFWVC